MIFVGERLTLVENWILKFAFAFAITFQEGALSNTILAVDQDWVLHAAVLMWT